MKGVEARFGPYLHAEGFRRTKTFNEHQGIPRSFTVLIAGAFDAGIIGPEFNGIAVLDDDNRSVVLDQHVIERSGYDGPSPRQIAEFERIMTMDWAKFTKFVREHPRYRKGSVPDAFEKIPDDGRLPPSDEIIFKDKPGADCPYQFPLSTKREIVEFLSNHEGHAPDRYGFCLSWDIKVYNLDNDLKSVRDEFRLDKAFDARWKQMVEKDDTYFDEACASGISQWTEGSYTTYPGDDAGRYEFGIAGRSGGHLVLTKLDNTKMEFRSRVDFIEWLEQSATDKELVDLYKLVVSCDHDLKNPSAEVEYQLGFIRQQFEDTWKAERDSLPVEERDIIAQAEAAGAQFVEADGEWGYVGPRYDADGFETQAEAAESYLASLDHQIAPRR
jgi:hypothetical protein